jgi:hypothetical protein
MIASSLPGVVVRSLELGPDGQVIADLALQRPSHDQALDEIAAAVQQLGYSVIAASASEWVSRWVEGALLGALGGGGLGSASRNADFAFFAGLIGALAGAAAGNTVQREKVIYDVRRDHLGRWHLTPVQPQSALA